MGSENTGRFKDYSRQGRPRSGKDKGGDGGGNGGVDNCLKPIRTRLEEVDRCDYIKAHSAPPPTGTPVQVSVGKRLEVSTTSGERIGYLPTKYNYLAGCISDGHTYAGKVHSSLSSPVNIVDVAIEPA